MAELVPAAFSDLVCRIYRELATQDSIFALPRKKWYLPQAGEPDLSVRFHGQVAGNPSGPAAGPQTQMAQNLVLSYLAGGRILELKTVQVNDRLTIPRPCIDVTNIGYNVEWSQELRVEQSLREYVAGSMLIEMLRRDPTFAGSAFVSTPGEVIYDLSVGYDLAGIRSEKVQRFLDGMRDARNVIETLRQQIPSQYKLARNLDYQTRLSSSLTLSTFHGCPADEIEKICEFLIAERDLNIIVKMNPPMLGKQRLEHLLHDVLGYHELTVNPSAYTSGLTYDEGVQLVDRLKRFAAARGKGFGCKFSNTLEVLNHRTFFTPDNKVQYLSGQPLHVITMTLTDLFRRSVGAEIPISFSAGIDRQNFASTVANGFVPVTVCTDLLRPGGYGRLPPYLHALNDQMKRLGATDIDDFILRTAGGGETDVRRAGLNNTSAAAERARTDPRYRADANRKVPNRIDSHLVIFDCITCDKCIPVCPNAANFTYPTPKVSFDVQDVIVSPDGSFRTEPGGHFEITETTQIANYADFCNECGNCDTFCPEYGGPYIKKPGFYSSEKTWRAAAPRDGFVLQLHPHRTIRGRIKGAEYALIDTGSSYCFATELVDTHLSKDFHVLSARARRPLAGTHRIDMTVFHTLWHLLRGVLDSSITHQANAALSATQSHS